MHATAETLQSLHVMDCKPASDTPGAPRMTPEEWYDLVVEASADGSWFYDVEKQQIHYSPSFLDTLDLDTGGAPISPEQFMARVHPDDREPYKRLLVRYLKGETGIFQTEIRVFTESGEVRWILSRGIARRDGKGYAYCMLGSIVDITRRRQLEDHLRAVALSTTEGTGPEFFQSLARYLSEALGSDLAIIGRLSPGNGGWVDTVAVCEDGRPQPNFRYDLVGTPCQNLFGQSLCAYPDDAAGLFPDDALLVAKNIRAYIGSPLLDSSGTPIGIIVALFTRPVPDLSAAQDLLTIFASRAAAELERQARVEALSESEQRFRDFAEVAADIFWEMDAALRFSYFNEQSCERLALRPDGLLGRTLWELARGQVISGTRRRELAEAFEYHAPFRDFDCTVVDGRGRHRLMSFSGRPVFNPEHGGFEGYRGVATEITDQRRAEVEYRDIFDNAIEGIYRSSPEGRLLRANPSLVRLHGFDTEAALIDAFTDLASQWYVSPEDRARITRTLEKEGRVENFECEIYRRATGERIWVIENARAVYGDDGTVSHYEGMIHDITDRRRLAAEYRDILNNVGEGIYRSTPDGRLVRANRSLARLQGFDTPDELIAAVSDLNTDWYLDFGTRDKLRSLLDEQGYVDGFEAEVRRLNGEERIWTSETVRVARDSQGGVLYYEGSVRDITADYKARELARRRGTVLEMIARQASITQVLHEIVSIAEGQQEHLNAAIFRIQEGRLYSAAVPGLSRACTEAINGSPPEEVGGVVQAALDSGHEVVHAHLDQPGALSGGLAKAMRESGYRALLAAPIRDQQGMVLGLLTAFSRHVSEPRDASTGLLRELGQITSIAIEQQRLSMALRRQAHYDILTELPNRALLSNRLDQAIHDAKQLGHSVGVLLLDLDEFKVINDSIGHSAGDRVLQEVASRLRSCIRAGDTVARLGGDEFVVVVPLKQGGDRGADVAGRILKALDGKVAVAGREVTARPSIGISRYPEDGRTPEALLQAADTAMYAAKQSGRNRYRFFDRSMNRQGVKRLGIESE